MFLLEEISEFVEDEQEMVRLECFMQLTDMLKEGNYQQSDIRASNLVKSLTN